MSNENPGVKWAELKRLDNGYVVEGVVYEEDGNTLIIEKYVSTLTEALTELSRANDDVQPEPDTQAIITPPLDLALKVI